MDDKFRLVFRGEILEGQHRAVVKRRLMELMKLSEAQLEKLFSGKPVVIKSDVDKETAARYQAQFKQAGGQLRVLAEQPEDAEMQSVAAASGSSVAEFTVQTSYFSPPEEPRAEIQAPDFEVADVGSTLIDAVESSPVVVPEPDFELAEPGVDILTEPREAAETFVATLEFEIADLGATLGVASSTAVAMAPDVSHLQLVES